MKENLLKTLASLSTKINLNIKHVRGKSSSINEFHHKVTGYYSESVLAVIHADFENDKKAFNLYKDFYASTLENLNSELNDTPEITRIKYFAMQDVVSINYLFIAYLIRNDNLELASMMSDLKVDSIMDDHCVSRAVLTMSARNGVPSPYKGWFIGRAIEICETNEQLFEIFFHNKKELTKYLCQTDFIQYVLEYRVNNDVYDGYPNFLFFAKSNINPLIAKLSTYEEFDGLEFQSLLQKISNIRGGEFFSGNLWRGDI